MYIQCLKSMYPKHEVQAMYDIACVLAKHLKVSKNIHMYNLICINVMTCFQNFLLLCLYSMHMDTRLIVRYV